MATLQVKVEGVEQATAHFNRLRQSIDAVTEALDRLGSHPHGGIVFKAVGEMVICEVKPVSN